MISSVFSNSLSIFNLSDSFIMNPRKIVHYSPLLVLLCTTLLDSPISSSAIDDEHAKEIESTIATMKIALMTPITVVLTSLCPGPHDITG